MIDSVRNILGDLASGKIKDARIALLGDTISALERENADLRGALSNCEAKLSVFAAESTDLRKKAEVLNPPDDLSDREKQALHELYEPGRKTGVSLASALGLSSGDTEAVIDRLDGRGLARRCTMAVPNVSSRIGSKIADAVEILPKGRALVAGWKGV